ncbi:MAG: TonB-dependent receptor [bacterium]|nr:TonB-dependent receptor [bacterium]
MRIHPNTTITAFMLLASTAWGAGAGNPRVPPPQGAAVEEMVVVGDARPEMDVLAGATTTRIETDLGLIEGAQIDDLLAQVPGVQVRRFGGVGERFEISIRGSTPEQVPVFLDGVRLDSSLTGRSDLSTICLDVLEEIQVTRGAGAARSGTGAIGGVINLVSRRAPTDPETRLRVSGGNFHSLEGSAGHARRIDDWDLSLAYCGFHTDGDFEFQRSRPTSGGGFSPIETRKNNASDRHTALTRIGRGIGEGRFRLTQLVSHLDRGSPGLESPQRVWAEEKNLSVLTSATVDLPVAPNQKGRFKALLAHRYERNDFEDAEPLAGDPEPVDIETAVHSFTGRGSSQFRIDTFGGRHEFAFLVEGRLDQRGSNEAKSKSRGGVALRAELASHWLGDRLKVSPSLRFERYAGLEEEWIPGLFVEGHPGDWLELKASLSRSYRIPSFEELYLPDKGYERGNEDLEPEEAWNFEIGAVLRSPFDIAWLDGEVEATWFAGEVDQSISFQLISTNVVAPVNVGRSTTRGYEVSLRWRPHPWVRLTAARTVTRAEIDDSGESVGGIALSQTDGRLEFGPRERFKLVGEVHYTGRLPLNSGDTVWLASRVAFDASASIDLTKISRLRLERFGRSLWLSLRGRNLGNVAIRDTRFNPRPGRNFSLALESVF